jgi:hypothetical protein
MLLRGTRRTDRPTLHEDLHQIRLLKARYCRHLDSKAWTEWRALFVPDLNAAADGSQFTDADTFVTTVSGLLAGVRTVHRVAEPEIALTGSTTATVIWPMHDVLEWPDGTGLRGHGYYRETLTRVAGRWVIETLTLTRQRLEPLSRRGYPTAPGMPWPHDVIWEDSATARPALPPAKGR